MRGTLALAAAPLVGVLLLTGCASTVNGQGSGPPASPSPTSSAPSAPSTPPTTPTTSSAQPTGIGDPGAADLCRPIQAAAFKATFDDPQYAGSCSLTVGKGAIPQMSLDVTALPPKQAKPRAGGATRTVDGLSVVAFPPDQIGCERDIWMALVVLSVNADGYGSQSGRALCAVADRLTAQEAHAISTGSVPRRPLASPSLVTVDMCRGMTVRDLQGAPGGGTLTVQRTAYRFDCRATNPSYSLGAEVVFHRTAVKARGATTVRGHRLVWFDIETSGGFCQVMSIQKPTANPAIVEGVGMYLIAKTGHPSGQQLCNVLTGEAAKVLDRLGLS